ncbi:MAG: hypothetical protein HYX86_05115 [Chloroflexi bacterium]|nr:hypothetical protein [Chloroflexota bacterium]
MTTKKIIGITFFTNLVLLSLLLAVLVLAGPAGAGPTARPSQQGTYLCGASSASDFTSVKNGQKYLNRGDFIMVFSTEPKHRFVSDISLPDGATIAGFHLGGINNTNKILAARLFRQSLTTGVRELIAEVEATGPDPAVQIFDDSGITPGTETVDNDAYVYSILWQFYGKGDRMQAMFSTVDCNV